jgi:ketosteroid isomerase-like protein
MEDDRDALATERRFFTALVEADVDGLDRVLADDFLLIDVMAGSEVPRDALLAVIGSGQLVFESITPLDSRVRSYPGTAIVTGSTRMSGRFEGTPFAASSRYTHVYVERQGRWRLVAAQGTQIAPEPDPPAS